MEEVFKRNLLSYKQAGKPKSFSDALFPNAFWKPLTQLPIESRHEGYSEKKQVLESFERFAAEAETPVIKVDGGEIHVRSEPQWGSVSAFSQSALSLGSDYSSILFKSKIPGKVKALFVTETFRAWDEVASELKAGFINELLTGFPFKTAELFERMILAMKLTPDEVLLYPADQDGKDLAEEVLSIAAHFKPEVIITLGAKATQRILKNNDRLSLIHGQFFKREIPAVGSFQVVPLFHPSIIENNQNMKKTAWADMQKIMKLLKKLP